MAFWWTKEHPSWYAAFTIWSFHEFPPVPVLCIGDLVGDEGLHSGGYAMVKRPLIAFDCFPHLPPSPMQPAATLFFRSCLEGVYFHCLILLLYFCFIFKGLTKFLSSRKQEITTWWFKRCCRGSKWNRLCWWWLQGSNCKNFVHIFYVV